MNCEPLVLNSPAIENKGLVKIYSHKNRVAATMGFCFSFFMIYFLMTETEHLRLLNPFPAFPSFSTTGRFSSTKLILILAGFFSALLVLRISCFPNVVISEKKIKIGWKFGGKFGLTYRHDISWNKITQVDSGGSKMIQWSPDTSIIYHTGKIPIGRSSDLEAAVISTSLGVKNYCKILSLVIERSPKAKVDDLTLYLIKKCRKV